MSSSGIDKFAGLVGKAEVEEAKYRGQVYDIGCVKLTSREASELLDDIRRLERERDDAVAENLEAKA